MLNRAGRAALFFPPDDTWRGFLSERQEIDNFLGQRRGARVFHPSAPATISGHPTIERPGFHPGAPATISRPFDNQAPGFPSERPGDDLSVIRQTSARFLSESRSGRGPLRRDDPTISGWKAVSPAQRSASSRGEAGRPTGGGRPRRCCADGRRRGEDAPPGVRRGFSPPPSPSGSPPARRSFRPIAPAVISRRSDHRPPGVSPAGAAATIPSHPADGRGGFRRRSRRCLVSGAGRRPVQPAAGGRPSSAWTDDGAASGGGNRRPEPPTPRRQRRL